MTEYKVFLTTTVTSWVTVEAEDEETARELALEEAPYAPGFANYEFGEWDVEEVEEEQK